MESRKMISMPICNKEMETQMERKDLWTQWGRERVRQMEKVAWTFILLTCVKYLAGAKLLYNTGSPAWGSVMT